MQRRILVIGSQCEKLARLSFLPHVAEAFYDVMTDADLGCCAPALPPDVAFDPQAPVNPFHPPQKPGLLLDPTVTAARRAIQNAYKSAGEDEAILVLAYVGHGDRVGHHFYLMPHDAMSPPIEGEALNLVQIIGSAISTYKPPAGLVVLVDACHAGAAAVGAGEKWLDVSPSGLRFSMLTAVSDRKAAGACFTQTLTSLVKSGSEATDHAELYLHQLVDGLKTACPRQFPQNPTFNEHPEMFLAHNVGWDELRSLPARAADLAERLTEGLVITGPLRALIAALAVNRVVAVTGPTGSGKSTLLAACARPKKAPGVVPRRFLHAVSLTADDTTPDDLAADLARQLGRTVPEFAAAAARAERGFEASALSAMPAIERKVLAPLRLIPGVRIRLAIDDLDQMPSGTRRAVDPTLAELATSGQFAHVRLLFTMLDRSEAPGYAHVLSLQPPSRRDLRAYFRTCELARPHQSAILRHASGNWLVARLTAEEACRTGHLPEAIPVGLSNTYTRLLREIHETTRNWWKEEILPVLEVLAVAGAGPIVPFRLIVEASRRRGGSGDPVHVRDALGSLRTLVVRHAANEAGELAGVIDRSVADVLYDDVFSVNGVDRERTTRSLLEALEALAPPYKRRADDPVHLYAIAREAELCWQLRDYDALVRSLEVRQFAVPRDVLAALRGWSRRCRKRVDPRDPQREIGIDVNDPRHLKLTGLIAQAAGEAGRRSTALRLLERLVVPQTSLLTETHHDTLWTRAQIAHWTGRSAVTPQAYRHAAEAFEQLHALAEAHLGAEHRLTLNTIGEIGFWRGMFNPDREVTTAFEDLAARCARAFGEHDLQTLTVRGNLVHWTGATGGPSTEEQKAAKHEALVQVRALLPFYRELYGVRHPETLRARNNEAVYLGAEDVPGALVLARELIADAEPLLGVNHELTLQIGANVARLTGEAENPTEAGRLTRDLVQRMMTAFGPDHPLTMSGRIAIGRWLNASGDFAGASAELEALMEWFEEGDAWKNQREQTSKLLTQARDGLAKQESARQGLA